MSVANRLHCSEIIKELSDLFSWRNETVKDATFLGWGPADPVAYDDYIRHLSSLSPPVAVSFQASERLPDRRADKMNGRGGIKWFYFG